MYEYHQVGQRAVFQPTERPTPGTLQSRLRTAITSVAIVALSACGGTTEPPDSSGSDSTMNATAAGDTVAAVTESAVAAQPPIAPSIAPTSTATPPPPGQGPTRVTTSTINSIDTIVADMRLKNDAPLAGAPVGPGWTTGPGHVQMGNRPQGSSTASWWQPYDQSLKGDAWWNVMLPWMVIFDGVDNAATNTRIEFRNLSAYYKSRSSGRWILISQGQIDGANYPKSLIGSNTQPADVRKESTGTVTVRPAGGNNSFHGWCCGKLPINAPDVEAVFVTLQARLVVGNPTLPDDRARARYLVQVGADYYPTAQTRIEDFAPTGYNPGVGLSRFKLITNTWQSISFTTLDVGVQDPPGRAISEAALRAAPPPLE